MLKAMSKTIRALAITTLATSALMTGCVTAPVAPTTTGTTTSTANALGINTTNAMAAGVVSAIQTLGTGASKEAFIKKVAMDSIQGGFGTTADTGTTTTGSTTTNQ